jgi:calcium-dependent protein kinase
MFSGSLPFDSDDHAEVKRMTVEEPLMFVDQIWKTSTGKFRDLLLKMLEKDSGKRFSVDAAFSHCFFKSF